MRRSGLLVTLSAKIEEIAVYESWRIVWYVAVIVRSAHYAEDESLCGRMMCAYLSLC